MKRKNDLSKKQKNVLVPPVDCVHAWVGEGAKKHCPKCTWRLLDYIKANNPDTFGKTPVYVENRVAPGA